QSGVAPKPKPKPEPVPTGLFLADGEPFGLRKEAADGAEKILPVLVDMPIKKLKEVDATWWQVEVTTPTGSTRTGFARRAWLKDQIVMSTFEEDLFASTCLSEARAQGTNAHFLIGLADAENALRNAPHPDAADRFGPFALTAEDWAKANDIAKTGY